MPIKQAGLPKQEVTILQLNVGLHCNQACTHCHVESSPRRKEMMDEETVAQVLRVLENSPHVKTVDITGGAPEMHSGFWPLVRGARALGLEVIDRCSNDPNHCPHPNPTPNPNPDPDPNPYPYPYPGHRPV